MMPPIDGLDAIDGAWTNREATTAKDDPRAALMLGGGVVGVEMSQAFQTLGSQVTLIEGARRLLPQRGGVRLRPADGGAARATASTSAPAQKAERVEQADDGTRDRARRPTAASAVGDKLLVALGREPSTKDLGVEDVGLEPGKTIKVDAHNRVPGHEWLYAIGDINGKALFTHMGKYQARLAADHLLGHDHVLAHGADGKLSPRVIFTEPQVAAVGHTTETAEEAGLIVEIVETETSGNAGGSFYGRNAPGHDALDRRPGAQDRRRLHDHRRRGGGLPARGDDRDRRRGAGRATAARGAELPDAQRDLAEAAGLKIVDAEGAA